MFFKKRKDQQNPAKPSPGKIERRELRQREFERNFSGRMTAKITLLLWFLCMVVLFKFFPSRVTLDSMLLPFIPAAIFGWVIQAVITDMWKDKIIKFFKR